MDSNNTADLRSISNNTADLSSIKTAIWIICWMQIGRQIVWAFGLLGF